MAAAYRSVENDALTSIVHLAAHPDNATLETAMRAFLTISPKSDPRRREIAAKLIEYLNLHAQFAQQLAEENTK